MPDPTNERTPIVAEANTPSYKTTEGRSGQQTSGSQPQPQPQPAAASRRQQRRRSAGVIDASNRTTSSADELRDTDTDADLATDENWFSRVLAKYGAVELDNKGSTARDHLALERTFLAWLRTSLSFAGIGIAVTQLFRLNTTIKDGDGSLPAPDAPAYNLRRVGKPLGAAFLAVAVIVLLAGWRRYFEAQFYIIKGKFPASRGSIFLTTFAAFALVVATFVIVLIVDPSRFEAR